MLLSAIKVASRNHLIHDGPTSLMPVQDTA